MARAIPKRYLEQIAAEDPNTIDEAIVAAAGQALAVRSDGAPPVVLCHYERDGTLVRYDVFGDTSQFPATKEIQGGDPPAAIDVP